jgi:hypothetical protein
MKLDREVSVSRNHHSFFRATSRSLLASALFAAVAFIPYVSAYAQEQSRESMAVDATAAQWSFQFAYEGYYDYKTDTLDSGVQRPEGNKGFLQFRLVAPIPKSEKNPVTWLPRLTLRAVQNKDGDYGFGSSDIFVLGIAQQWATGRWGLGPLINFPAQEGFGSKKWGFGLAAAVTQRAWDDKLFLVLLLQQTWRKNPAGETKATPLSINPVFVLQLGDGWYFGNGDYIISYNWQNGSWFIPFGVRFGRAIIGETTTWNAYVEYSASVYYDDWIGPVATHALRVNVQFQIPII